MSAPVAAGGIENLESWMLVYFPMLTGESWASPMVKHKYTLQNSEPSLLSWCRITRTAHNLRQHLWDAFWMLILSWKSLNRKMLMRFVKATCLSDELLSRICSLLSFPLLSFTLCCCPLLYSSLLYSTLLRPLDLRLLSHCFCKTIRDSEFLRPPWFFSK
jgi:hypothetical protein